jgi:hypothetical protein
MKFWAIAMVICAALVLPLGVTSCGGAKEEGEVKVGPMRFVETNRFEDSEWLRAASKCEEGGKRWAAECTELRTFHEPVIWKEGEEWVIRFER